MSALTVLHVADLHLGVESYGHLDPATGMSTRLGDFLRAFDQAIDEALGLPADLVVFAGDAYKTRDPSQTHQREFAKRIARLAEAGIPTLLLVGNHDLPPSALRANTLDIFATLNVPNVRVARSPAVHHFDTRHGPVQVAALPWLTRHALLTKDELRDRSIEELDRAVEERVQAILRSFEAKLDPDVPAILTAHCSVAGAVFGSERSIMLGQDLLLQQSLLAQRCFRYVALGHIHKHQILGNDPPLVYAGSLERIDFGEEREEKGYVIVRLGRDGLVEAPTFRPVNARRFVTVEVTCRGDDPLAEVRRAVDQADIGDAVVRLIVHAKPEHEAHLVYRELRALLRAAHYVARIHREIVYPDRSRPPVPNAESWTPLQALTFYLKQRDTPPERLAALLDRARALGAEGEA